MIYDLPRFPVRIIVSRVHHMIAPSVLQEHKMPRQSPKELLIFKPLWRFGSIAKVANFTLDFLYYWMPICMMEIHIKAPREYAQGDF